MIPNLEEIIEDIEQKYLNGNITDAKETLFKLPAELAAAVGANAVCIPATKFVLWAHEYIRELELFQEFLEEKRVEDD